MSKNNSLLNDEDRSLLLKVSNLLEVIIETLDITEDKELTKSIEEAEKDVKSGNIRDYNAFRTELKRSGDL